MNENEVKIQLRDRSAKAKQSERLSPPGTGEAYYNGKATAFAEAIELIEELESEQ